MNEETNKELNELLNSCPGIKNNLKWRFLVKKLIERSEERGAFDMAKYKDTEFARIRCTVCSRKINQEG
jgi:hypothetical protein